MTSPRRQSPLAGAITLLTVLPTRTSSAPAEGSRLPEWFPLVGLAVFGLPAASLAAIAIVASQALSSTTYRSGAMMPLLLATSVIFAWALLSRFMHWDGLADTFDALWGGMTQERRLEIMRDSSTGAFGVTAIVFTALLQCAALAAVVESAHPVLFPTIIATPALGRLAATFASWFGEPVRSEGLGAQHSSAPGIRSALVVAAAIGLAAALPIAAGLVLWYSWAAVIAVGIVAAAALPHMLSRRFGGVTGDVMGASILLTEAAVLLAAAVVAGV